MSRANHGIVIGQKGDLDRLWGADLPTCYANNNEAKPLKAPQLLSEMFNER